MCWALVTVHTCWALVAIHATLSEVLAVPPLFLQESSHSGGIPVDSGIYTGMFPGMVFPGMDWNGVPRNPLELFICLLFICDR